MRKDVECAFGILVQRFHVLARPFRGGHTEDLCDLVKCCTIIHNVVAEARFGLVAVDEEEAVNTARSFPLFGRNCITAEVAAADGVNLFAGRVAEFDRAMRSSYEPFLLKQDFGCSH